MAFGQGLWPRKIPIVEGVTKLGTVDGYTILAKRTLLIWRNSYGGFLKWMIYNGKPY